MKHFKNICIVGLFFFVLVGLATRNSYAQLSPLQQNYDWVMPQLSPQATVSLRLGVTDIKITYHRPFVKGREIWGKIVPYGEVWRAGANETTVVSFGTEVLVEGQKLPAGTYGLFMQPTQGEWEIIFNKIPVQWGAFTYKQTEDILRVKVKPQPAEHQEALEYSLPLLAPDTAQIVLRWEKIKIPVTVTANVLELAKAKANTTFNWQTAYFATNYFLDGKKDLNEALRWSTVATVLNENYSTLLLKARVLGEMGRTPEAIQTAERAIELNKTAQNKVPNTTAAEKMIADWKKSPTNN